MHLARECARFSDEQRLEATLQAAWHVLQRVAAKALAYDVRVLEVDASLPIAKELDKEVDLAAKRLMGVTGGEGWTTDTSLQLQWPAELGGMACGSAELSALLGRLATLAQCLPTARKHLRAILLDASEDEILNAVPLESAERALSWLKEEYQIEVSAAGTVAKEREPRLNLKSDFRPMRGLMGTLTRAVQEAQRDRMLSRNAGAAEEAAMRANALSRRRPEEASRFRCESAAFVRHNVRLRSAAGDGKHSWVDACPKAKALQFTDAEWRFAARWRLGLAVSRVGPCQLRGRASADEESNVCGKRCNRHGDHAILCARGCGRYRAHNAICRAIRGFAKSAGTEAEAEVTCPEVAHGEPGTQECVEARLDVHLWASGQEMFEEWVDVTVTHPGGESMRQNAAKHDGAAAESAEARKRVSVV